MKAYKAVGKFTGLLDSVTTMIEELTVSMTQLTGYSTLFPGQSSLDACLQLLVDDYVGFCVTTVLFFKKHPARK